MARYGMVIDLKKCVGCDACTVACKSEWDVADGHGRTWVKHTGIEGIFPDLISTQYVGQCNHCDTPTCIPACPTGATYQRDDGIVVVDRDLCIGCGYCVDACPYGARYIHPEFKVADKCDFCVDRLQEGLQPVCVETCTSGAKVFGDLEDRQSQVFDLVYRQGARRLQTKDVAIGPNVYYLGSDKHIDLVLEKFKPHEPRLKPPAKMFKTWLRHLVGLGIAATFLGQAGAFFFQLFKGENEFEE